MTFWIINGVRLGMLVMTIAVWFVISDGDVHKAIEGGLWFVGGILMAMLVERWRGMR